MPQGKKYVRVPQAPAENDNVHRASANNGSERTRKGASESGFDLIVKIQLAFWAVLASIANYMLDLLSRSSYVIYVCCGECALGSEKERRRKLAERRRDHLKQLPEAPLIEIDDKSEFRNTKPQEHLKSDDARTSDVGGIEGNHFLLSNLGEVPVRREPHDPTTLRIGIVTWNLAESVPSEADIAAALATLFEVPNGPWVIAVAAQECGPIIVNPFSKSGQKAASAMFGACGKILAARGLVPLAFESLGATCLSVFVHRSLFAKCSSVEPSAVACGSGGRLVNKGAVAIGFHLLGSRLCFISSHLAAHEHKVIDRHDDYHRVTERLFKGGFDDHWDDTEDNVYNDENISKPQTMQRHDDNNDLEANRADESVSDDDVALADLETSTSPWAKCPGEGKRLLEQFEAIFWAGDLNYRLDTTRERADRYIEQAFSDSRSLLRNQTKEKSLIWLLRRDQLLKGQKSSYIFKGFTEGEITFKPTFKLDPGTDTYDSSKKQRVPSWTDRILYKPSRTKVVRYESAPEVKHGDHRPVVALFDFKVGGRNV